MTTVNDLDLAQKIERLADIEIARGIHHDYAQCLDTPDPTAVAAFFTDDALLRTPIGEYQGRAEIEAFYTKAFAADPSVKQHFIVNTKVVDTSPGTVRLVSYFLYVGRATGASTMGWGTYDDLVDVSGDAPRFKEKTIGVLMATDLASGWPLLTT